MAKENNENAYANACNTVNNLMDSLFDVLGLSDSAKYHITEEELRKAADDIIDKEQTEKDKALVEEYKKKYGLDLSDLVTTVTDLISKYSHKTDSDTKSDVNTACDCEGCACAECCDDCCPSDTTIEFECTGDCGNCDFGEDCLDMYNDMLEYENPSEEHCASVMDRLKSELADYKKSLDDTPEETYTYEQMLFDINSILDDPDSEDYEFIVEDGKKDVVKITYHVGYETQDTYRELVNYARNLDNDLKDLYGFSNVYISSDNNEEDQYITFYIFMEI